jgi:hypothetical protein
LRNRQLRRYSRISQHFMKPEGSLPCSQEPSNGPYPEPDHPKNPSQALRDISEQYVVIRRGIVNPMANPQAGVPPLIGCPRLLIQYNRSCPPYMEAVSSIRNLRTRCILVTRDPLNMGLYRLLLIQYIRSYPPYMEAVSSIRNLRTRCILVTRGIK